MPSLRHFFRQRYLRALGMYVGDEDQEEEFPPPQSVNELMARRARNVQEQRAAGLYPGRVHKVGERLRKQVRGR